MTGRSEDTYSPEHVRAMLTDIGVEVHSETTTDYLCFCPYHYNRNTPSFSVGKTNGLWICFNGSCGRSGVLPQLITFQTGRNTFETLRFIAKKRGDVKVDLEAQITQMLNDTDDFKEYDPEMLAKLRAGLLENEDGIEYLEGRGFTRDTIDYFECGYSAKRQMVTVPVHSPLGLPVGLVARSISEKRFKNSAELPRNRTMFNLHRAKKGGGTVIITESAFDTMKVHQSGMPNAVGLLGGHLSPIHFQLLDYHFNRLIIMTDNPLVDEAGRKLGERVASKLKHKSILWAMYEPGVPYPEGCKDAMDCTEKQVRQMVANAVSTVEYEMMMS